MMRGITGSFPCILLLAQLLSVKQWPLDFYHTSF